jgi:hypothetical protein
LLGTSDYTSLVNFYGTETYFTRGAFLDIVVNKQMCKTSIQLQDIDYISSILENSGFFFLHNDKTKYFIRVVNTLGLLIKNNKYKILQYSNEYEKIIEIFNNIKTVNEKGEVSYDTNYCQWIDEKTFDLLKCEKYTIFNLLLKINYEILNIYSYFYSIIKLNINEIETFKFYYKFVKNDTLILGKKISNTFKERPIPKSLLKHLNSPHEPRISISTLSKS